MVMELTIPSIVTLSIVDSINPCAIAVLIFMLLAIMTYAPSEKKKVLHAGLSFVFSIFLIYILYGVMLILFFGSVQTLSGAKTIIYPILGLFAVLLGFLNIKDYFWYKPGGLLTEMPMMLRPRMKKMINGVASSKGAFVIGAFVTLFLLPCTIGPYVIANGLMAKIGVISALPWLILYNSVFVLPMIVITLIVYKGVATTEEAFDWRNKNIKYLHLVAGTIMVVIGIAITFGLI